MRKKHAASLAKLDALIPDRSPSRAADADLRGSGIPSKW